MSILMQDFANKSIMGHPTTVVNCYSKYYPKEFSQLPQPVSKFFAVGNLDLLKLPLKSRLAIVGSRRPTTYGTEVTKQLATAAARANFCVVSGLAFGIDALAQSTALKCGGKVIAVLPCSVKNIYPSTNQGLAKDILNNQGLILSEYEQNTSPQKYQFIARNRLIAALTYVTVIPEAGASSGSLHTAQFALELNRVVAAVPGEITSSNSLGCNQLIKDGANVICSPSDMLYLAGYDYQKTATPAQSTLQLNLEHFAPANQVEEFLVKNLKQKDQTTDNLTSLGLGNFSPAEIAVALTSLEIQGIICRKNGRTWSAA